MCGEGKGLCNVKMLVNDAVLGQQIDACPATATLVRGLLVGSGCVETHGVGS
jgi:hypothetical protein